MPKYLLVETATYNPKRRGFDGTIYRHATVAVDGVELLILATQRPISSQSDPTGTAPILKRIQHNKVISHSQHGRKLTVVYQRRSGNTGVVPLAPLLQAGGISRSSDSGAAHADAAGRDAWGGLPDPQAASGGPESMQLELTFSQPAVAARVAAMINDGRQRLEEALGYLAGGGTLDHGCSIASVAALMENAPPEGPAALLSGPLEWGASLPLPEPWLEAMLAAGVRFGEHSRRPLVSGDSEDGELVMLEQLQVAEGPQSVVVHVATPAGVGVATITPELMLAFCKHDNDSAQVLAVPAAGNLVSVAEANGCFGSNGTGSGLGGGLGLSLGSLPDEGGGGIPVRRTSSVRLPSGGFTTLRYDASCPESAVKAPPEVVDHGSGQANGRSTSSALRCQVQPRVLCWGPDGAMLSVHVRVSLAPPGRLTLPLPRDWWRELTGSCHDQGAPAADAVPRTPSLVQGLTSRRPLCIASSRGGGFGVPSWADATARAAVGCLGLVLAAVAAAARAHMLPELTHDAWAAAAAAVALVLLVVAYVRPVVQVPGRRRRLDGRGWQNGTPTGPGPLRAPEMSSPACQQQQQQQQQRQSRMGAAAGHKDARGPVLQLQLVKATFTHQAGFSLQQQLAAFQSAMTTVAGVDEASDSDDDSESEPGARVLQRSETSWPAPGVAADVAALAATPYVLVSNPEPAWLTRDVRVRICNSKIKAGWQGAVDLALKVHAWRSKHGADALLGRLPPHFDWFMAAFDHHLIGIRQDMRSVILLVHLGELATLGSKMRQAGIPQQEFVRHLAFLYEFMFEQLVTEHFPRGRVTLVTDMTGLSLTQVLSNPAMKELTALLTYYPSRLGGTLIVNPPGWFSTAWRFVSAQMSERARARTRVLMTRAEAFEELSTIMPAERVPEHLGGPCTMQLEDYPEHQRLLRYAAGLA